MRIYENGIYRDMTPEEIAELEKLAAEAPAPVPEPTPEERIAALEKADSTRYDNVTMTAAGWKGKTYSFEAAYPSDLWNIVISVAPPQLRHNTTHLRRRKCAEARPATL